MPPLAILAKLIVRSHLTWLRSRFGSIDADFGSTHERTASLDHSVQYVQNCFADYRAYGQLASCHNLEILEAGPGDNFGVGALFLAHGARRYTGVDLFYSRQNPAQQLRIYEALRQTLPPDAQARFDLAIERRGGSLHFNPDLLRPLYGHGIHDFRHLFPPASFDVILSRAVLEQVHDLPAAFASMDAVLRPGGWMLHKIDFSDYGTYSRHGHHPLTLHALPSPLYSLLAPHTGQLNRYTLPGYRRLISALGYEAQFFVTGVIRSGYPQRDLQPYPPELRAGEHYGPAELDLLEQIRPRLPLGLRDQPAHDLIAAGIFLAARKPGAPPSKETLCAASQAI